MSYQLTEAVWHIDFTDDHSLVGRPTLKLVMLALARRANDEGDVLDVPREVLMRDAAIRGRSYWGSAMRVLERDGWLDRVPGRGRGNFSSYLLDATRILATADVYASSVRRAS